jgi:hypothetical protein
VTPWCIIDVLLEKRDRRVMKITRSKCAVNDEVVEVKGRVLENEEPSILFQLNCITLMEVRIEILCNIISYIINVFLCAN